VNATTGLRAQLRTFDPVDLAAQVEALQLLSQKADHLLRLERLAVVVASLPARADETPRMDLQGWRDLLNTPPVAGDAIDAAEDGFCQPYTDSILCPSGAFTVLNREVDEGFPDMGAPDQANSFTKIASQREQRGWTSDEIQNAFDSGEQINAINKATGGAATRHINPDTGQSVVIDNATGEAVHVGGQGFQYGQGSGDVG
jgi:hypothetical protein